VHTVAHAPSRHSVPFAQSWSAEPSTDNHTLSGADPARGKARPAILLDARVWRAMLASMEGEHEPAIVP